MPTARLYSTASSATPPFTQPFASNGACEQIDAATYNREQARSSDADPNFPELPPSPPELCWTTNALSVRNGSVNSPSTPSLPTILLGSLAAASSIGVSLTFQNGLMVLDLSTQGRVGLTSLSSSTTIDLGTGNVSTGAQTFKGLPVIGFAGSSFNNGLLDCSGQRCSGNFGVAYPLHAIRDVSHP
jgi:hypothetical protein